MRHVMVLLVAMLLATHADATGILKQLVEYCYRTSENVVSVAEQTAQNGAGVLASTLKNVAIFARTNCTIRQELL